MYAHINQYTYICHTAVILALCGEIVSCGFLLDVMAAAALGMKLVTVVNSKLVDLKTPCLLFGGYGDNSIRYGCNPHGTELLAGDCLLVLQHALAELVAASRPTIVRSACQYLMSNLAEGVVVNQTKFDDELYIKWMQDTLMLIKEHMVRAQKHWRVYKQTINHLSDPDKELFDSLLDKIGGPPKQPIKEELDGSAPPTPSSMQSPRTGSSMASTIDTLARHRTDYHNYRGGCIMKACLTKSAEPDKSAHPTLTPMSIGAALEAARSVTPPSLVPGSRNDTRKKAKEAAKASGKGKGNKTSGGKGVGKAKNTKIVKVAVVGDKVGDDVVKGKVKKAVVKPKADVVKPESAYHPSLGHRLFVVVKSDGTAYLSIQLDGAKRKRWATVTPAQATLTSKQPVELVARIMDEVVANDLDMPGCVAFRKELLGL